MAAGEDEAQPVVLDLFGLGRLFRGQRLGVVLFQRREARPAPDRIDRLEAAGRDEPRARVGGNAIAWPLLERRAERIGERLLGEIEIAQQAHQRREYAPRLGAIDGGDLLLHGYSGWMPASRMARPQISY